MPTTFLPKKPQRTKKKFFHFLDEFLMNFSTANYYTLGSMRLCPPLQKHDRKRGGGRENEGDEGKEAIPKKLLL